MPPRSLPLLLALAVAFQAFPTASAASLRKEFTTLEEQYRKGELDDLAEGLLGAKPNNDDERALVLYLNAMLKVKESDALALLQQAGTKYPATLYGQTSILEQAKILILIRQAAGAKILLAGINSASLLERYYWLGVCAEMLDDTAGVINHAENYLRLDPRGEYSEQAHFLLAEAYLAQGKHQSAVSTLNRVPEPKHRQYYLYLLGLAYQKAGNYNEALSNYKRGIELDKYSQIAFQIEDQLFELQKTHGSRVDLSFLYPYEELDLPIATGDSVSTTPATPPPSLGLPLKLGAKPSQGIYVQAGRFSVEANASSLSDTIRRLNLSSNYFEDKGNKSMPWVVVSGPYPTKGEADSARSLLLGNDIDCFITTY
jgi:tetratricopeptide (TPR) repeat protein